MSNCNFANKLETEVKEYYVFCEVVDLKREPTCEVAFLMYYDKQG